MPNKITTVTAVAKEITKMLYELNDDLDMCKCGNQNNVTDAHTGQRTCNECFEKTLGENINPDAPRLYR